MNPSAWTARVDREVSKPGINAPIADTELGAAEVSDGEYVEEGAVEDEVWNGVAKRTRITPPHTEASRPSCLRSDESRFDRSYSCNGK
jgi:hypothetical protein